MKSSSNSNPQGSSPLINLAIVIVLILTALPIVLFALFQIYQPTLFGTSTTKSNAVIDAPKRLTAAERRAEREEARNKEKETTATRNAPIVQTMTTVPGPGMGPGMDFGPGGMGPGGFGGPGMDFGPGGMGGFGGGPGGMGGFGGGPGGMGGFGGGMGGMGGFGGGMGGMGGFGGGGMGGMGGFGGGMGGMGGGFGGGMGGMGGMGGFGGF